MLDGCAGGVGLIQKHKPLPPFAAGSQDVPLGHWASVVQSGLLPIAPPFMENQTLKLHSFTKVTVRAPPAGTVFVEVVSVLEVGPGEAAAAASVEEKLWLPVAVGVKSPVI